MIVHIPEYKKIGKLEKLSLDTNLNESFFDNFEKIKNNAPSNTLNNNGITKDTEKIVNYAVLEKFGPEVKKFLDYYDVTNYTLRALGGKIIVDVNDHLFLPNKNLRKFNNFSFGRVYGDCNFANNNFTDFTLFPRIIDGNCIANYNLITDFTYVPEIGGTLYANKQKGVKKKYPLTHENYLKYRNGELLENFVHILSTDTYGELIAIEDNKEYCKVKLHESNIIYRVKTDDVDCLCNILKLLD